jgi:hypothetical protein
MERVIGAPPLAPSPFLIFLIFMVRQAKPE